MEPYTDEEDIEDSRLYNERDHHCQMFFKVNCGGVDNKKAIIYATKWDVYMNKKKF